MYSRSYFQGEADISVPDNYDGTAFLGEGAQAEAKAPRIEPLKIEKKFSPKDEERISECGAYPERDECHYDESGKESCRGFDARGIFSSLFPGAKLSSFIPKGFGVEDVLLIGIALFLLFSPERDIECALLLLALVFIR